MFRASCDCAETTTRTDTAHEFPRSSQDRKLSDGTRPHVQAGRGACDIPGVLRTVGEVVPAAGIPGREKHARAERGPAQISPPQRSGRRGRLLLGRDGTMSEAARADGRLGEELPDPHPRRRIGAVGGTGDGPADRRRRGGGDRRPAGDRADDARGRPDGPRPEAHAERIPRIRGQTRRSLYCDRGEIAQEP